MITTMVVQLLILQIVVGVAWKRMIAKKETVAGLGVEGIGVFILVGLDVPLVLMATARLIHL